MRIPHRNLPMSAFCEDAERLFGRQLAEDFSRAARIYEDGCLRRQV